MFGFKFKLLALLLCAAPAFGQLDPAISITDHRQLSISQDNAHIDKEGDAKLNTLGIGNTNTTNSVLDIFGTLSLQERAAAVTDTINWGQIWVKNTSPTELWYTDDLGSDFNIGSTGGVAGSGTAGKIAKWSSASILADSIISESGTLATIAGTLTAQVDAGTDSTAVFLFENTGSGNSTSQIHLKTIDANWRLAAVSGFAIDTFSIIDAATGNTPFLIDQTIIIIY